MRASSLVLLLSMASCASSSASAPSPLRGAGEPCGARGVAVQVLGSGGPIADQERASAGYVVWMDGSPKLIVDLGGGTFQRLGAAGVDPGQLRALVLTHLHVDHTADLPALLKSASFGSRSSPLPLIGPSGDERFPPLEDFIQALVGREGAFRYLSGYLGDGNPFPLELVEVDVTAPAAPALDDAGLVIRAVGVPHGPVPALGILVAVAGVRVAFTGDQRMDEPRFAEMIRGADLLIAHHAIPEDASASMRALHAPPSQIGALAASTRARALVLSHHMPRSLETLSEGLQAIAARYEGPVHVANDLECFELGR